MKSARHKKILEVINRQVIETQSELVDALLEAGFNVTQATVSRDIKELGLIKIPVDKYSNRYAVPLKKPMGNVSKRLRRLFQDSVTVINESENLIVIKTLPGTANAVASCIDNMEFPEIIGTVAGDDTILIIAKPKRAVAALIKQFEQMLR